MKGNDMTENELKALKIINAHGGMKVACADPAFYKAKAALRRAFKKAGIQLANGKLAIAIPSGETVKL
jgi:hypothetical protein